MRYLYAFGLHIGIALAVATFLTFAVHKIVGETGEATAWSGLLATLGVLVFLPCSLVTFGWMFVLRRRGATYGPKALTWVGSIYGAMVPVVIMLDAYRSMGGGLPPLGELARVLLTYGGVGAIAAYLSLRSAVRFLFPNAVQQKQ
jgi:hypothetical protein